MNLKRILTLVCLLAYIVVLAQKQASIWYFGEHAGVDFSSGLPIALTNGELNTIEGCATISNSNGDLLFYTDGTRVWDKNHVVMPNGTDLKGNPSSSQSAVIVPHPVNYNQYYIFCVQAISHRGGLYYSLVDLSLNEGMGDVITSQKNINLLEHSAEKIAAIEDHDDGYWILSYAGITGTESDYNTFHAFRINDLGISPSVKTTFSACGTIDGRGYLKISADGTKMVICNQNQTQVCLYNFNAYTGVVSAETSLHTNYPPYSAEFSPSSEKLYVSTGGLFISDNNNLYQFDLTSSNIQNSRIEIHNERSKRGALQLGIDGKIYYARPEKSYLGVISDPERNGLDCNYINEGVFLNGKICKQGLPPFIQSYLLAGINANSACESEMVQFSLDSSVVLDSVVWDFGDGNSSTMINPQHSYDYFGTYIVTAQIISGSHSRNLSKEVLITQSPNASPVLDDYLCDDSLLDGIELFNLELKNMEVLGGLSDEFFQVSYFLTLDDAINHTNVLPSIYSNTQPSQEIIAKLYTSNNVNCFDTVSFKLHVENPAIAHQVQNVIICDDPSNDGSEQINLSQFKPLVLNAQSTLNYEVSYHLTQAEANNGFNPLPNFFQTINNPQLVFARIQNRQVSNCYDTTSFEIEITNFIDFNQPNHMYLCDDVTNDGVEIFDLHSQDEHVVDELNDSFEISYYESQEEADANLNAIIGPYSNRKRKQEVFYRIENTENLNCYQTGSFFIEVLEYEKLQMEKIRYKCPKNAIRLIADAGYDTYLWSTGETTQEIEVQDIGSYQVTVTKLYPLIPDAYCNFTETISVLEFQPPIIDTIEIEDWSANNNTFIVNVIGNGDYEYSLNDVDYQNSPIFEGLNTGDYTVYVRDKNGCAKVSESVYALFYPKYFTPNGDGYHDYWNLYFSEQEPDIEIFIVDRFGKPIKQIDSRSKGWDGTLNGLPLPISDYWFIVNRPSKNKQHKGHFTLKR